MTNMKCLTRGALAVAESAAPVLTQKETLLVVPEPRPRAMVLHPLDDDLDDLLGVVSSCGCRVEWWTSLADALAILHNITIPLVICESQLVDGTWRDLLRHVKLLACPPPVIVTCRHADDALWTEVLSRGGYDVLVKPFDMDEVVRVVSLALQWWHDQLAMTPELDSSHRHRQSGQDVRKSK